MTIMLPGPLVLAGAGKMGSALLTGLLQRGLPPELVIVQDPAPSAEIAADLAKHGIAIVDAVTTMAAPPAVILAAVKPQVMDQVFPPLAKLAGPQTLVISIAAGRPIASFARHLPGGSAIVRTMPNTPASIGRGITACTPNAHVTPEQRSLTETLMAAIGDVAWVDDEALLDAVTAVSGSGPAYVFLLAEALADAGEAAGLSRDLARQLARATVTGAAELLHQSELEPGQLRQNVTSPGGTTAAALSVLMAEDGLTSLMTRAVALATQRGKDLAK